jgi:hypothetical protein
MKKLIIIAALFAGKASAQIQMDKVSHMAVGGCIGGFTYCLGTKLTDSKWKPTTLALTTTLAISVGKELHDKRLYNSSRQESFKDISYTMLGAALSCITLKITF